MTINLTPLSGNVTSLNRLFDAVFKQFGDLIAFSHGNTSITYSGLDHKSRMLAGWLQHNSGLEPGDRVAIQLPNTIQFPLCMLAVLRAGFVIVNANPSYTPAELNQLLIDSGSKALITFAPLARKAQIAMNGTQINCVILTELGDLMPPLKGKVLNQYIQRLAMPFSKHAIPDAFWLKDLLRQEFSSNWQPTYPSENQLALIQYTGGTTGTPKGAMLSHQNLCANLFQIKQLLEIYTQSGQERLIQPLPLYHIYAFTLTLAFFSQGAHTRLIINPKETRQTIKAFSKFKPTICAGIDPLFNHLLNQQSFHRINFSMLKLTVSGGMALSPQLAQGWHKLTGCPITEGYGLTECSPVVSINKPDQILLGTVGEPLIETEIRIIDDHGKELPLGEIGEIQVRGPQVMQGYWNQPIETQTVLSEEGWFSTGDLGCLTQDKRLRIIDRKKELISVSGFKVFPSELETLVCTIPGVEDCAAVGVPDEVTGEKIKLFVVTDSTLVTPSMIREFCKERLTGYKIPTSIEFCSSLPRSSVGKVQRNKLKEKALQKCLTSPKK